MMDIERLAIRGNRRKAAIERFIGKVRARPGEAHLVARWIETPLGAMLAVADRRRLHLLEFADREILPGELARLQRAVKLPIAFGTSPPLKQLAAELKAYFAGTSAIFKTPLAYMGTAFSRQVWAALRKIKPATTRTYADLARAVGRPSAIRAAGRANGANLHTIVVPCHRIVSSDGNLTGYGGGLWRKAWLLEHERRVFGGRDAIKNPRSVTGPGAFASVSDASIYAE